MSLYERCVKKWGVEAQMMMAMEEAAEFIQACSKAIRCDPKAREKLAEEIADLRLMLDQVEYIGELYVEVADWQERKRARLEKLLEATR